MQDITFEIPGKPHPKGRPRLGKWGVYTPPKTKEYEEYVKKCFIEALDYSGWIKTDEAISVQIYACYKRAKSNNDKYATAKADVDNLAKSVLDALNGIAYNDDKQIVQLLAKKMYYHQDMVMVRIIELGGVEIDQSINKN